MTVYGSRLQQHAARAVTRVELTAATQTAAAPLHASSTAAARRASLCCHGAKRRHLCTCTCTNKHTVLSAERLKGAHTALACLRRRLEAALACRSCSGALAAGSALRRAGGAEGEQAVHRRAGADEAALAARQHGESARAPKFPRSFCTVCATLCRRNAAASSASCSLPGSSTLGTPAFARNCWRASRTAAARDGLSTPKSSRCALSSSRYARDASDENRRAPAARHAFMEGDDGKNHRGW